MTMRTTDKPFKITKKQVYEAYKAVKSNHGAAGVDKETIEQFEADLKGNLFKLWNRMSSGSYFPPPVRAVSIPKKSGGERILGVPTVADRVAQTVVKQLIEPDLDPIFLADSYGYRPRKSALDAIGVTRERCWRYDWILEFDIKGLFDNVDHELLLRAVRKHVQCKWALLLHRKVVEGDANGTRGRDNGRAYARHPSRRCRQPHFRESVYALHVRSLDGADISRPSLVSVCR
jgi:RNA-directed DNA polymerase